MCNRSYDARPYPRAWALKTLPFAPPPCHLSAVTLLDLSPSPCLCTKCLRIPLAFSKLRARYMLAYGNIRTQSCFLRVRTTRQTRRGHLNLFFRSFLLPRVSPPTFTQVWNGSTDPFQPWDDCSFVFRYFSSCPRRDYGELGENRSSPSLDALWVGLTFGSRVLSAGSMIVG